MKKFKRIIGFCLLLFGCFCLMSCGSNATTKLSCNKEISKKDGMETKMVTDMTYKGDKIIKVNVKWSLHYDNAIYTEKEMKTLVDDTANSYRKVYGSNDNIKITTVKDDNSNYSVNILIYYDKLTKDEKEYYRFNFPDGLDKSKEDFESEGYTCKSE